MTTEPTCTVKGVRTYTCSKCGNTYTEQIPANGHTWSVKQQVTTEYDENGNLVTQGYTLYECSVCGEQYKDETGAGPPSSGGSEDSGGSTSSSWWKDIISALVDGIKGLGELIGGVIVGVLEAIVAALSGVAEAAGTLVAGLGDIGLALAGLWAWLPEPLPGLVTAVITVSLFVALIRLLRG